VHDDDVRLNSDGTYDDLAQKNGGLCHISDACMSELELLTILIETIDRDDLYGAILDCGPPAPASFA
jgi:hypothetical protein